MNKKQRAKINGIISIFRQYGAVEVTDSGEWRDHTSLHPSRVKNVNKFGIAQPVPNRNMVCTITENHLIGEVLDNSGRVLSTSIVDHQRIVRGYHA